MTKDSATGRKLFHVKCMSWSYRNRGNDARIHRKITDRSVVLIISVADNISGRISFNVPPKKRMTDSVFMKRMFAYSAKKNIAKGPAAYSTLKPETSSDSPSARSKGARLVSARVEMNHIMANGHALSKSQLSS